MRTILILLFLTSAVFVPSVNAQAPVDSIEALQSDIKKLESIDASSASADVKELNREFLTEKRQKLLRLLTDKQQARRDYLSSAMSNLTSDEILKVQQEIIELRSQIKDLQKDLQNMAPITSVVDHPEANNPPTVGSPGSPGAGNTPETVKSELSTPSAKVSLDSSTSSAATDLIRSSTASEAATPTTTQTGPAAASAPATPTTVIDQYKLRLAGTAASVVAAKQKNPKATIDIRSSFFLFALALIAPKVEEVQPEVVADFTSKAENVRTDKQTGANTGTGGTTSLVTKAGIPAVFGFAVENGALTRTDNNTIVTFSGTPVGIIEALAKKGFIDSYQDDDQFDRALRKFSFKLNFDTSRGDTPGTFTGTKQQLAGYSLRYNFLDQRDPRDEKYTNQWKALVADEGVKIVGTLGGFFREIFLTPTPAFAAWRTETETAVANAAPADVETVLSQQLVKLRTIDLGTPVNNLINSFGTQFDSFLKERDDILDQVNAGWTSTFEYNNERRVALPSISNLKFIIEKGAYGGSIDLTANASISFLNSIPAGSGMKRLRDYSVSGQLDWPLGNVASTGKFILSFAGQFERLDTDEQANGVLTAAKGNIGIGQVKLAIPVPRTAFKIPLSFTFANRTELIKEKHVRGSFGFTFDLDSLLAKFNPFSQ